MFIDVTTKWCLLALRQEGMRIHHSASIFLSGKDHKKNYIFQERRLHSQEHQSILIAMQLHPFR